MPYGTLTDYAALHAYLGKKDDRPLANNTRVQRREDGAIAVRLHSTDVVTHYPDGSFMLRTGGWYTLTTKQRMNAYSPVVVASGGRTAATRGKWLVMPPGRWDETAAVLFYDGMRLSADGELLTPPWTPDETDAKENRRIERLIRAYVAGLTPRIVLDTLAAGTSGDCLMCQLRTASGESLGDATRDRDHLLSHLDERYYMASVFLAAMDGNPYRLAVVQGDAERGHVDTWLADGLRRYFRERLIRGRVSNRTFHGVENPGPLPAVQDAL
jgi:hypothetical protein